MNRFTFRVNEDTTITVNDLRKAPDKYEAVIEFVPEITAAPHTPKEHAEIAKWTDKLNDYLQNAKSASPPATRIGDADVPHCSGMTRAEGSPDVYVNKIPWSRQGDVNTPHLLPGNPCPNHAAPIAVGSTTVFINKRGAGRIGDSVAGCTSVAQGSPNVFCG